MESGMGVRVLGRALAVVLAVGVAAQVLLAAQSKGAASERPWMNTSLSARQRADLLIGKMTLDEKITMMHGVHPIPVQGYVGYVPGNARLGIPALRLADGRAAVGNGAIQVTLLPAPIAAASSWDTGLMNEFGRVLGEEQWKKGTNVALAPSIDVVRVPEWGRTFESYGEDPYFNGQMAVAEIKGIQSQGPIANANMYVTMNQESNRMKEDSRVDERTLEEIYIPPFAAAIRQGHVGTVMCAYVKTNGTYSCENQHLLEDILRKDLHFDGWVMSDWGATHSTVGSAEKGLDQEMPDDKYFGAALKAAVESGAISMVVVDRHVRHILVPMFRQGLFDKPRNGTWAADARSPQHDQFALKAAEQGTVLLKDEGGILPLAPDASVVIVGAAGSASPKVEGGGSSQANPPYVVGPLEGIRKRVGEGVKISYADGSDVAAAAKAARDADVAIVFVKTEETEGADRPNLELPGNQDALVEAVARANKRTIVVLDTGGPVLMPWVNEVAGVIEAWYSGQEDGNAIAAVLYGDVNPSAKLPLTFPRSETEMPTAAKQQWPGVDGKSIYSEGLKVGYRWYDSAHAQPLFPFGFGLSYTTFRVSGLKVEPARDSSSGMQVSVGVSNTGKRAGAEVVQVYVEHPKADGEPPHQLRAFAKIWLKPGEMKTVHLTLGGTSFSIFSAEAHRWVHRAGRYEVLAGTSSRDLPLRRSVDVK